MGPVALAEMLKQSAVSPYEEVIAFEYLYSREPASLKKIVDMTVRAGKPPSEALKDEYGFFRPDGRTEIESLIQSKLGRLSVAVKSTPSWPSKLSDSEHPTPLFYYYGDIGLLHILDSKAISIVGSRHASPYGLDRAAEIARGLSAAGFTIVSGLAAGVDTAALSATIANQGHVIGVIGTPIDECYPRQNRDLQKEIAENHLLVSQVPFYRYSKQPFKSKGHYFPERNELMAALSDATLIIEASDTSGTLHQARACLYQHRPLLILRSCYEDRNVSWPKAWAEKDGVFIVDSAEDIVSLMGRV